MSQFEFQPLETSGVVAGSEGVAAQQLNEATFEPRAYVEQSGMLEQAEAIEANLTTLIENAIGPAALASSSGGIAGSGAEQVGITPINLPREADLASSSGGVAGSGAEQVGITPINLPREADLASSSGGVAGSGAEQVGITPINLPREANFASSAKGPGGDPAGDVASGAVKGPGGDGVANGGVRTPGGGDPVATSVEGGNATSAKGDKINGEVAVPLNPPASVEGGNGISWKWGGDTPVPLNPPAGVEGGNATSAKGDKINGEVAVPLHAPASVEGGNAISNTEKIGEIPTPIPSRWEGFSDKTTGESQVPLNPPASVEGGNGISWKWGGDTPVPLNPPASVESGNAGTIEAIGASQLVNSLGLRLNIALDASNQIEGRVETIVAVSNNDNTDIPGDLTSQRQLEFQQLMEKKTQSESILTNILKNFDQTQRDLVANLK
jgi:hypothetical protein